MPEALLDRLWRLASGQRWFPGPGAVPVALELGTWAARPDPGPGLRPAIVVVRLPDGHLERFLIPLLTRAGHDPEDACDDGAVLLDLLRSGAPGFVAEREIPSGLPARRFRGEQSNTTIFYGDQLLAKVFRRIEPGPNPDIELHRVLADTGAVARLYGTWHDDGADLAVFLEAFPDARDGYDLARSHAAERRDFTAHARALGGVLSRIHLTLARRLPVGSVSGEELVAGFRDRFAQAAAEVPQLEEFREAADLVFDTLPRGEAPTQRIHGDCHLGQALFGRARWVFVDFEGEPLVPLARRRLPDSPLKDVAGVLRSFAYAQADGGAPGSWRDACRAAFLDGYGLDPSIPQPLLRAYEIDKAGYEALYEARYRPRLLRVPIDFLSSLL